VIARHSFVIIIGQASSAVLGMLALFFVSKLWGGYAPGLVGIVWFGFSFVGTFSFISNLGFDAAHVKKISEGKDLGKCNGTYLAIKLMLSAIMVLSVVGCLLIWEHTLGGGYYDSTRLSVIYIFLGYYVLLSLAQIPIMTFNSLKKNAISQTTMLMESLTRAVLFLVVALAGIAGAEVLTESGLVVIDLPARFDWPSILHPLQEFISTHVVGALAISYLFGGLAMFVTGFLFLRKYPVSRPDKQYMGMYMKFAVPLMVPVIFILITSFLDKVLLGYFWTAEDVGYYFSVQRICTTIVMIPSAIGIVLFPTISAIYAKGRADRGRCNRMLCALTRKCARFTSMVTIPIVAVFIVFSIPIIDIALNSSFRPGAPSMQILSIYTYIATMYVPYYILVLGTNRPINVAKVFFASGITNIAFNLLLIPRGGLLSGIGINGPMGAATATLISTAVIFAGLYYYSVRFTGRPLMEGRMLKHIAAGFIAGLAMFWLAGILDTMHWYHVAVFSLAGLGIYLGVLWAWGEFRRKELDFFLETMNPMLLLRYVKSEMSGKNEE